MVPKDIPKQPEPGPALPENPGGPPLPEGPGEPLQPEGPEQPGEPQNPPPMDPHVPPELPGPGGNPDQPPIVPGQPGGQPGEQPAPRAPDAPAGPNPAPAPAPGQPENPPNPGAPAVPDQPPAPAPEPAPVIPERPAAPQPLVPAPQIPQPQVPIPANPAMPAHPVVVPQPQVPVPDGLPHVPAPGGTQPNAPVGVGDQAGLTAPRHVEPGSGYPLHAGGSTAVPPGQAGTAAVTPGLIGAAMYPGSHFDPRNPYQHGVNGLSSHNGLPQANSSVGAVLTQCGNVLSNLLPGVNGMYGVNNPNMTRMITDCMSQLSGILAPSDPRGSVYLGQGGSIPANQIPAQSHASHVVQQQVPGYVPNQHNTHAQSAQQGVASHVSLAPNTGLAPSAGHVPANTMDSTTNTWLYMTPHPSSGGNPVNGYGQYTQTNTATLPQFINATHSSRQGRNNYPLGTMQYKLRAQGISARAIDSAIEGEFCDLCEFLAPIGSASNIANNELEPIFDSNTNTVTYRPKKFKRQIVNYDSWYQAWCNFEKLMVAVHGVAIHEVLSDYRTFIMEANKKFVWGAVAMYDFRHRSKLGSLYTLADRLKFSEPSNELINTVLDATAVKPNAIRCQRCRGHDHIVSNCPFPEAQKTSQNQTQNRQQAGVSGEICLNFNRERCSSDKCKRRHVCNKCKGQMPHSQCKVSGPCARSQVSNAT